MRIPGSEIGSRWDIEFTFEPTAHIRDVLVSAFARISRDTLRFEAMVTFDPGVWRIDIRPEVVPVPGLVCSLVVGGTGHGARWFRYLQRRGGRRDHRRDRVLFPGRR